MTKKGRKKYGGRDRRQKLGKRYVTRDRRGRIKTSVSIGRSLAQDRRRRSWRIPKGPGKGHRGDYHRRRRGKRSLFSFWK